jgi:hypothetical protein
LGKSGIALASATKCSRIALMRASTYSETVSSFGYGSAEALAACCCSSSHFWTFGSASNAMNSAISGGVASPLADDDPPVPLCGAAAAPDSRAADRNIAATQVLKARIDAHGRSDPEIIVVVTAPSFS